MHPQCGDHTQTPIKKGITQTEQVQRRAARWVTSRYGNRSSPTEMLAELGWTSLEDRRRDQCLAMMYKISTGLVALDADLYLTHESRTSRHIHAHSYTIPTSNTDYHHCAFFPRTVREWNSLPPSVVQAPTYGAFRARLAKNFTSSG